MPEAQQFLEARLAKRKEEGKLRDLSFIAGTDFYSNDYLGLARHGIPGFVHQEHGTGSGGSRLLSGNSPLHEETEALIAAFHDAEAALLFSSGYAANTGLLSCVADRHSSIFYDELCHASILDGIRLSLAAVRQKFRHNDLADLERKLGTRKKGTCFVVVESLYSMDGDEAPLREMAALCSDHGALLIVDEAHATGVFGSHGEGLVQEQGLARAVFARVHTFGKALGCHGAAVTGSASLKNFLVNFSRPFIYTTALPPQAVGAIAAAYRHLKSPAFSNEPLHRLIAGFRAVRKPGKGNWKESRSPVQSLLIPGSRQAAATGAYLRSRGFAVKEILHPTVAEGSERLRICLHSFNTQAEIDLLVQTIEERI